MEASGRAAAESSGLRSRRLAAYLLKAVLRDKQPFDEAFASLSAKEAFASLEFRDRAFARAIAAMALRRLGQIEDLLSRFLQKPVPAEAVEARFILIAGAAQLAFMEVAPHAAISLAVEHAKNSRAHRYAGLINAVLRKVAANAAAIIAEQDALALNAPAWLFQRWEAHYGEETARLIAAAHLIEPALDLSVKSDAAVWAARLGGEPLRWGTVSLKHHKGRIEDIEGYAEGSWWVQDAAAALPALLLGDVSGKRVADLCAAPGGKTLELAARGAIVTAVDISASRLRRLQENLDRVGLRAEIVQADVAGWTPAERFDAVLLDAPCTSTGTIRRNPDIPYLKTPADIAALSAVQSRLLDHALSLLKPGGELVYSTCSLEAEEGEAQIERLLAARPDVSLVPIDARELQIPAECVIAARASSDAKDPPHSSPLPSSSPWRAGIWKSPHHQADADGGGGAGRARCDGVSSPLAGEGQGEGEAHAVRLGGTSAGYLRTLPFHGGGMDGFFAARLTVRNL